EGEVIEVGIADPDPGERAELEVAAAHVGVERPPLVGPDVDRDADRAERRLDRLGEPTSGQLVRGLEDDPEAGKGARAVRVAEAGPVEETSRPAGVVSERPRRRVRPVLGSEEAARVPGRSPEQEPDERVAVEREADRLPDA